jgi:hypothetical protein
MPTYVCAKLYTSGRQRPRALADRLERNQRPQSDQAIAAKSIRALRAGRAVDYVIELRDE